MPYLTQEQKDFFKENGYLILRKALPEAWMNEALDLLWNQIPQDRNDPKTWVDAGYFVAPNVGGSEPAKKMVNESPVFEAAEDLVGKDTLVKGGGAGPHLNFPRSNKTYHDPGGHLDGYYTPSNGVTKGTVGGFTLGATMYLSEVKPGGGSFTIRPGSHKVFNDYFRTHPLDGPQGGVVRFPLGEPFEFTGEPGDVCLWHYWMYHTAGPNIGDDLRIAFIARYRRKDVSEHKFDLYDGDLWRYWEGLR